MQRLDLLTSGKILPIDGKIYWHIDNFTWDMDKFEVILTFEKMFRKIQPYFVPEFVSTSSPAESQITLRFRKNGDADLPEPFDSGTLAYAYLANNTDSKGYASDVFFNDGYTWTEMHSDNSISLLKVAVHEVLHACGMHHSDNPEDILFWQYQNNDSIVFSQDTIEAIYKEYGFPGGNEDDHQYLLHQKYADVFQSWGMLSRLLERQLVKMAFQLRLTASVDDLKRDTIDKIDVALKSFR